MMHDQNQYLDFSTETMRKKREYSYYHANRDY